jgi:hypothetical protein
LWLRDPSEYHSGPGHSHAAVSELFGALKPLSNVSLPPHRHGLSADPVPSLPPLPQLPAPPAASKQSLEEAYKFFSNSITTRDASVQPLENEPSFFFRAFADVEASTPSTHSDMRHVFPPSQPAAPPSYSSPEATAHQPASSIWSDARVLLAPPPLHCEPCSLSPLMSMMPSEVMSSGTLCSQLKWLLFVTLCPQC